MTVFTEVRHREIGKHFKDSMLAREGRDGSVGYLIVRQIDEEWLTV